jgi:hypothetical protein
MNSCDVCGREWNPQIQEHRRGIDCAAALREILNVHEGLLTRLRLAYQAYETQYPIKEKAVIDAFEEQRNQLKAAVDRIDALAKRVNLLEHPKLSKVPSMPRAKEES